MIYEFYGTECPHCEAMRPVLEQLEKEGVAVERFEVWHDENNAHKMEQYDKEYCGGVPFFVNPKSGKWICGETTYDELKTLAQD